ncbi:protein phosphatase CheZ [Coralloluteibacterium stylophorae]|uniref:Protein phosphatase CheZ n=1 Tax=Coralloluteibacterium stylophorae TaxID=1776034 RepID=A0A8J7VSS0_9GAMM|nr:protein phosphatase CheZ [Coralloluteibacterium stylophorae]MBS7457244.1 protein phosphatase CheZ [Coralloluteibacterium stylophorae]
MERGDDVSLRGEVEALAAWRAASLVKGLSRIARELGDALGEIPAQGNEAANELPDACDRLDHVVKTTEEASLRTLDLIEAGRGHLDRIAAGGLDDAQRAELDALRASLSEISLAQSFQDLTGQTIRKVVGIVRRVHEGFNALGLPPEEHAGRSAKAGLAGPAVPGLDRHAVSQEDADDLLSALGL